MNRKLTFKRNSGAVDAIGQPVADWSVTVGTAWAEIFPQRGATEVNIGERETAPVRYTARIRYRTDLTTAMRAYEGATAYDIVGVTVDVAGREYTELTIVAGVT